MDKVTEFLNRNEYSIDRLESSYSKEGLYRKYLNLLNNNRNQIMLSIYTMKRSLVKNKITRQLSVMGINYQNTIMSPKIIKDSIMILKHNLDFSDFYNKMKYKSSEFTFEEIERMYFDPESFSMYYFQMYITFLSFTYKEYYIKPELILEASALYLNVNTNINSIKKSLKVYSSMYNENSEMYVEFIRRVLEVHETMLKL